MGFGLIRLFAFFRDTIYQAYVFDSKTPVFLPKTCRKPENIWQKAKIPENKAFLTEKPVDF